MKRTNQAVVALALASGFLGASALSAATINIPAGRVLNLNWTTGNEYILQGFCYVLPPDVLNIQAGVVVKGVPGSGTVGALDYGNLVICKGAQINANGTKAQPIIFTSSLDDVNDPTDMPYYGTGATPPIVNTPNVGRGYWGGLVLLGDAQINSAIDNAGHAASPKYEVFEGLLDGPDTDPVGGTDGIISGVNVHRFGGGNDADSSGTLRYVSIRHCGRALSANKEINALSMGGVGSGTTLEYVECYGAADDGFEWWGGTVNGKYLVSAFNDDDGPDTDEGFRGKLQFLFNIHSKDKRDDLSEQNGQVLERAGSGLLLPQTAYQIRNATLVGPGNGSGGSGNAVMNIRVYNACRWYNSIFTETSNNRLSLNQDSTNAPSVISANPFDLTGVELHGNIWWRTTTSDLVSVNWAGFPSYNPATFFAAPWDNQTVDPLLKGVSWIPDYGLDPSLDAGSPALGGVVVPPADAFYTVTTYKGAFGQNDYWMDGWTYLWERGFLDIGLDSTYASGTDTTTVSCRSVTGLSYQFQSSTDGVVWSNVGAPVAGTGATISTTVSPTPTKLIFRVKRA
jgi:hypothetical protein